MTEKVELMYKTPQKKDCIKWNICNDGNITLEFENKGLMKFLTQKLLKKPKTSYIHLDEIGSFVWCMIDGKSTIEKIGLETEKKFGKKTEPLYERLLKYFCTLKNYGFIAFDEQKKKV